ncbi:nickel import ATP-binding protein NikD [Streptomyces albidoflavus]|uniref:ATP-binding cassette domain-containing protein n=1 Tax=Streptomyces albidoflavus TaxID=1886 RepID=UPI000BAE50EB|nr:ABC transporter ATP-binding protein [Streptomyces albidoflavus]PAX86295.1 nickel import ATP-binding protein NikD [Streptomyces albidoflavus]PAX86434.1 nickel import ATP-binding protein NikD [Streptomyces albidoflavus]PBO15874.1 nickel import ATP-binding protein NikD [Streptomyces albidoflavus]PBO21481.1 nickel import ATP-binding protein NikD [Streptomyces albidoflavus]PBO31599.1 nickel import ATP-binding protein NikD [Streptomyces albidoflavus]
MTSERATTDPHPADERPLLEIDRLSVDFRLESSVVHAVQDVSLHVHAGETLAVVGESGSGKSATALSVLRLNPSPPCVYTGGEIRFGGRDLLTLSEKELGRVRGRDIAMVFQDPMTCLDPLQRVGTQVAEVLRLHTGLSRAEARKAALAALDEVGIPDPEVRYRQYPHELSGGLRQRVMIATALVTRPRVVIADEPTTALDVTVQRQILDLLVSLQDKHDMAVVLITHDLAVVAETADRVAVMNKGRVVETGDVLDVFDRPADAYTRRLLAATPRLEAA